MKNSLLSFLLVFVELLACTFLPKNAVASEANTERPVMKADYIFGMVAENCYENELYDKAIKQNEAEWLMSDASVFAVREGKNTTDLLSEVDNGNRQVRILWSINTDLTNRTGDSQALQIELLNGRSIYNKDMSLEDYLSVVKQSLPSRIVGFQQENITVGGKVYPSILYTFSDDAVFHCERTVFAKEGDYIIHIQSAGPDIEQVNEVLGQFHSIEELPALLNEEPDISSVDLEESPDNKEPKAFADPEYEAYEPYVKEILSQTDDPDQAYGLIVESDNGEKNVLSLIPLPDGDTDARYVNISNNQVRTGRLPSISGNPTDNNLLDGPSDGRTSGKNRKVQDIVAPGVYLDQSVITRIEVIIEDGKVTFVTWFIDLSTFQVITELIKEIQFNNEGPVLMVSVHCSEDGRVISEDEHIEKMKAINLGVAVSRTPFQNTNYQNQQLLKDILYLSKTDDKDLRENAQLEIIANRVSIMTGNDVTGSNNGFPEISIFNLEGLNGIIEGYMNEIFNNSGLYDFDMASMFSGAEYNGTTSDAALAQVLLG